MNKLEDFTEDSLPKKLKYIKCPKCEIGELILIADQHKNYYKCENCGWDSLNLYKK